MMLHYLITVVVAIAALLAGYFGRGVVEEYRVERALDDHEENLGV